LPFYAVPDNCQVATFVDNNFPRPAADDIYFVKRMVTALPKKPAGDPSRPVPTPVAISVLASLGLVAVSRRRRGIG
jgi:hypothetical protein